MGKLLHAIMRKTRDQLLSKCCYYCRSDFALFVEIAERILLFMLNGQKRVTSGTIMFVIECLCPCSWNWDRFCNTLTETINEHLHLINERLFLSLHTVYNCQWLVCWIIVVCGLGLIPLWYITIYFFGIILDIFHHLDIIGIYILQVSYIIWAFIPFQVGKPRPCQVMEF